jgi:hypothetical protein
MKRMMMAGLVAMAAGLAACESATGPSGEAEVQVAAQGDASGEAGSTSNSEGSTPQSSSNRAEGTVDFRARVWVRTSSNQWVELTQGSARQARVDASGREGAKTFHTARAEARSYNRVRVEFEEVKANVTGGIFVGTNLLSGEVRVDFGSGGKSTVERSIRMDARSASTLLIDLNSGQWLSKANSGSRTASRAEFESAVRVLVKN